MNAFHDWRWQLAHAIRTPKHLAPLLPSGAAGRHIESAAAQFPMAITPYYAGLIAHWNPSDPVYAMCVPRAEEEMEADGLDDDPFDEAGHSPLPGLIRRYTDRALIIVTDICATYCRYCTRRRVAGRGAVSLSREQLDPMLDYLRRHPEIRDVLLSGGDPLTLSTDKLEAIIAAVRSVPSVEIIRIGTRVPVTLPMRVTDALTDMLRKYHPLFINTHFNHPVELTPEAAAACAMLADAGIPLANQTVLLRGINDDPPVMEALCRGLLRMRVRPYYLFQCDPVRGAGHFRTPLAVGLGIIEYLRGRLGGLGIPTFIVDVPHGGKIPLLPQYIVATEAGETILRSPEGKRIIYPEPEG